MTAAGADKITIDLWTDVVCPWCYVGEGRLEQALEAEGLTDRFEIRTHSFELDPSAPAAAGEATNIEHLERKLGKSAADVQQMESQIVQLAAEIGRDYATERPMANTRRIHRVMQAIGERGRDFFFELQQAYFAGTANPFDDDVIIAAAERAGLGREETAKVLADDDSFDHEVETDIMRAHAMGASGVPFTVFDSRYAAPRSAAGRGIPEGAATARRRARQYRSSGGVMFERQRNMESDAELGQGEPDWLRKAEKLVQEGEQVEDAAAVESVAGGVTLQSFEQLIGGDVTSVSCTIDGVCGPGEASEGE